MSTSFWHHVQTVADARTLLATEDGVRCVCPDGCIFSNITTIEGAIEFFEEWGEGVSLADRDNDCDDREPSPTTFNDVSSAAIDNEFNR